VLALLFSLLSVPLVRRAHDLLALAILPQLIMLGTSWFALVQLARNISMGPDHHAAAAWCAEAQGSLLLGAAAAVLLSAVLFVTRTPATKPTLKTFGTFLGFVVLWAGEAGFAWYLSRPGRTSSPGLVAAGSIGVLLSVALGGYTASVAFSRKSSPPPVSARAIAALILLLAIGFGVAIRTFMGHLMAEAAGLP
jgi:uncharacterized membrane protein